MIERQIHLLAFAMDHAPESVYLIDASGRFLFANETACRWLGYTRDELLSMTVFDVDPHYPRHGWSEHWEQTRRAGSVRLDTEHLTKDGRRLPIEVRATVARFADRDYICAFARDVSERREAERTLERARLQIEREHAHKERLLASIGSILIALDGEDRITRWNRVAEETFGLTAPEVRGRRLIALGITWEAERIAAAARACRRGRGAQRLDRLAFTRPGGGGVLGLTLSRLDSGGAMAPGVVVLGADITDRLRMEAQLRHAQKLEAIGQLAAGIAHEINTPTQYVGDNVRFLREAFDAFLACMNRILALAGEGPGRTGGEWGRRLREVADQADLAYLASEIPRAIDQSVEGLERVASIVRAMKEFSRPSGDDKALCDLNGAIRTTVIISRNEWKQVAEVRLDLQPDLPLIPAIASELNQVLLNLIVNAAHAIRDVRGDRPEAKGTIQVATRNAGDDVEIRIADDGTGIAEEVRGRIFDPFFTTKPVGQGTGQGLSVAHTVVVRKHGGTIEVDSAVGRGTTVVIRLPRAPEDAPAAVGS